MRPPSYSMQLRAGCTIMTRHCEWKWIGPKCSEVFISYIPIILLAWWKTYISCCYTNGNKVIMMVYNILLCHINFDLRFGIFTDSIGVCWQLFFLLFKCQHVEYSQFLFAHATYGKAHDAQCKKCYQRLATARWFCRNNNIIDMKRTKELRRRHRHIMWPESGIKFFCHIIYLMCPICIVSLRPCSLFAHSKMAGDLVLSSITFFLVIIMNFYRVFCACATFRVLNGTCNIQIHTTHPHTCKKIVFFSPSRRA